MHAIAITLFVLWPDFTIPFVPSVARNASLQEGASTTGERLMQDTAVRAAVERLQRDEPRVVEDQMRLCAIPAPPFNETVRAEAFKAAFLQLGLKNVRIDGVGNVLGERQGESPRPHLVFSAHLDTVFPEGTDVRTSRSGSVIKGPGISDDCRGLAVVLGVARALNDAGIRTPGTITFVGTVGEEGLGDLRGVKHLFNEELKGRIDRFVSVDGAGSGMSHVAVGSLRYRVTVKGPGGHSYGNFGIANPVHALGRAIGRIANLPVPREPKTTFSVGRIGGGTSINSIASEAWMEMDMRSSDRAALTALNAGFQTALDVALTEENERWGQAGQLVMERVVVGSRPGGAIAADAPIIRAVQSVSRAVGLEGTATEESTDSNIPISLGIPAVTVAGGGSGSGEHTLAEAFDSTDSWKGTARALLLAIALTHK